MKKRILTNSKLVQCIIILIISTFPLFSSAFEIESPRTGDYKPGDKFSFNWSGFSGSPDWYIWRWTFAGVVVDDNGNLIPTETTKTRSSRNNESCGSCGDPSRSAGEFQIDCHWVSGTITFEVEAWEEEWCGVTRCDLMKEKATSTIVTILPLVPPPPVAIIEFFCGAGNQILESKPINSSYVTNWYTAYTSSSPAHTGPKLDYNFPEGPTTLYITQATTACPVIKAKGLKRVKKYQ